MYIHYNIQIIHMAELPNESLFYACILLMYLYEIFFKYSSGFNQNQEPTG